MRYNVRRAIWDEVRVMAPSHLKSVLVGLLFAMAYSPSLDRVYWWAVRLAHFGRRELADCKRSARLRAGGLGEKTLCWGKTRSEQEAKP